MARLHSFGFPIPPGFVITTSAFSPMGDLLNAASRDQLSRNPFESLPPGLEHQLLKHARKLGGPFAVRSSLLGEDSDSASMAGQLDSFLDIPDESILPEAVRKCYASAFAPRLAVYRRHIGGGQDPDSGLGAAELLPRLSMAVVVQRMKSAQVAGVAFSADPVTGQRCVIVEAAEGSPDDVVGGRIQPLRWRVDARGVLVEANEPAHGNAVFAPERVLELARTVRRIDGRFLCPVDVEWLWDGEQFWFLQARPITTLVGRHIYSSRLVADMSPGLIKPLLWSTNTLGMTRHVFGRIFDGLLGPTGLDYGLLARRIRSRLYTDVTLMGELLVKVGLPANFFEVMARDELGERPRFKPSPGQFLRMRRFVPFLHHHLRSKGDIREHIKRQDRALERYRAVDWTGKPLTELVSYSRDLRDLHGRSQWFIFLAAFNSMLRKKILDRMVRRHTPDIDPADLIRGLTGLKALEPNRRLQNLAVIAGDLPEDQIIQLRECNCHEIIAVLESSDPGRCLLEGFASFMRDFGFLSANGTDISGESWVEKPELVWQMVAQNTRRNHLEPAPAADGIRREARAHVRRLLHPMQRGFFGRLLRSTVVYLKLRERVSLLHSEGAFELRRVFLALGSGLVEKGALNSVDDIFYLYIDELESLVGNELTAARAQTLVEQRREEMAADELVMPEETVCGDNPPPRLPDTDQPADYLVGIGGSSGLAEGYARIVHDPLVAPTDLGSRDILVVPFTDVGWTPLFAGIGGIVAETGGQLSHTSIVAREYNLPAVVSVPHATTRLHQNQPITLDGLAGRVYLGHVLNMREIPT